MFFFRSGVQRWSKTRSSIEEAGFIPCGGEKTTVNNGEVVVNWGCQAPLINNGGKILNNPLFVNRCSDKLKTIELLGDYMPKIYPEYSTEIPTPFVAKKAHGSQGRGKRKILRHRESTPSFLHGYDILQEWINIEKEYRIIAMKDNGRYIIFRTFEKVKTGGSSPRPIFHPRWDFVRLELHNVPGIAKQIAIDCLRKLELDLVGFDIAMSNEKFYLIEANSAPGLGVESAKKLMRKVSV